MVNRSPRVKDVTTGSGTHLQGICFLHVCPFLKEGPACTCSGASMSVWFWILSHQGDFDKRSCCRWLDADGSKQVGSAFEAPQEVLRLPQGIKSVSAGLHSSAAVSRDGQLWIWGKVISKV